jgi:hypothetical protein
MKHQFEATRSYGEFERVECPRCRSVFIRHKASGRPSPDIEEIRAVFDGDACDFMLVGNVQEA